MVYSTFSSLTDRQDVFNKLKRKAYKCKHIGNRSLILELIVQLMSTFTVMGFSSFLKASFFMSLYHLSKTQFPSS